MFHLVVDAALGDGQELKQTAHLQFCATIQLVPRKGQLVLLVLVPVLQPRTVVQKKVRAACHRLKTIRQILPAAAMMKKKA